MGLGSDAFIKAEKVRGSGVVGVSVLRGLTPVHTVLTVNVICRNVWGRRQSLLDSAKEAFLSYAARIERSDAAVGVTYGLEEDSFNSADFLEKNIYDGVQGIVVKQNDV